MSASSSSYRTFESDDESNSWLMSSENGSIDDDEEELSDELTLLNGDENDSGEDTTTFEAFIKLSIRLKKQYNIRESSVALERCDKIWDTMQLVKNAQINYDDVDNCSDDEEDEDDDDDDYDDENTVDNADNIEKFERSAKTLTTATLTSSTTSKSYIKYQPTQGIGNNALPNFYLSVKSQRKVYNCATCGKLYNEKRAFRSHLKRDHDIALPISTDVRKRLSSTETRVTRSKTPQNIEANFHDTGSEKFDKDSTKDASIDVVAKISETKRYPCPICTKSFLVLRSMRDHAMNIHNYPVVGNPVKDALTGKNIHYSIGRRVSKTTNLSYRTYVCMTCGCDYTQKSAMRRHLLSCHAIHLPGPLCRGKYRERRKSVKPDVKSSSSSAMIREKSLEKTNDKIAEISTTLRQRAGPKSSKTVGRPRRACAVNTSYTECTKEEEEALQREIFAMSSLKQKQQHELELEKPSTTNGTKCFLCKSRYVDIKRHLKDYHRIRSPNAVLPLNEKIVNSSIQEITEKTLEKKANNENTMKNKSSDVKTASKTNESTINEKKIVKTSLIEKSSLESLRDVAKTSFSDKSSVSGNSTDSSYNNETFEGLYRRVINESDGRENVQCLMCLYKYASYSGVKRHLKCKMVNGVVQEHSSWLNKPSQRKQTLTSNSKDVGETSDPLEIDNFHDKTRPNDDSESDENVNKSRKRGISFTDESSSNSAEIVNSKKRKIDNKNVEEDNEVCDTTSNNKQRESVIRLSKKNIRYSVDDKNLREDNDDDDDEDDDDDDEDKEIKQRDTRDSSDRDSGIGISITIKKRNNSYEVVDKDSYYEDDKTKDNDKKNDENIVTTDSSSYYLTSMTNFINPDDVHVASSSGKREIFDTLNYSEVRKNETSRTTATMIEHNEDDDDDDDVAIIESTDVVLTRKRDTRIDTFDWRRDVFYNDEACSNMPGKVSSLKVLCRNVLRRDEVKRFMVNDKNNHQCPVCCRFYPTERDVTVHMLEHKVSRTAFRCARLHGIPSSSLRRYGRRKSFE